MINERNKRLHSAECKCLAWQPIFAGAIVMVGFSFLLNLFSGAIGVNSFTTNSQGVETLLIGGLIASALGIVVSMFASGWLTGYLSNRYCAKRHMGALYGFLAWCIALIIMVFIAEYLQRYINLYVHFISGATADNLPTLNNAITETTGNEENKVVISTYIIFALFFLSAFAASLGAHLGMGYVNHDERV